MPIATSMLSRNCADRAGNGEHAAVRTDQVTGEEVQADERGAGVVDGGHEVVDRRVGGHRLVRPGPPELDRVEAGGFGRRRTLQRGNSLNSNEQLAAYGRFVLMCSLSGLNFEIVP